MKCTFTKNLKKSFLLLSAAVILFTGCKTGSNDDIEIPHATTGNFEAAETSVEMAKNMAIGWNLGNALDASSCDDWAYSEGLKLEYSWLPHKQVTSDNLIKTVRGTNFKTIRIPISWHNHMDKTTYAIDSAWMNRVKHLVDLSLREGMCVIINIHHDNLTETQIATNPGFCLSTDEDIQSKSIDYITKVWEQISETFKDYDNKLVFELLNEPRCIGTDWEWSVNSTQEAEYSPIIKKYEQAALNTIRAAGDKNANRYLMVPGYAASPSYLSGFDFPNDTAEDKLLLSVHAYTPSDFALEGSTTVYSSRIESDIDGTIKPLYDKYVKNGIGVVIGEASASDKENTADREKWAKYYFTKTQSYGIPVVLWDNEVVVAELDSEGKAKYTAGENGENHGYFNRVTCAQYFPSVIAEMMKAVYGEGTTNNPPADTPEDEDDDSETTLNSKKLTIDEYGNVITLADLINESSTYDKFILTVKNESGEDRTGWGCISLILTDAEDPWAWHGKVLGTGEGNQLPGASSLKVGETYKYEIALRDLITALQEEDAATIDGLAHRLTIQCDNDVVAISAALVATN